MLSIKSDNPNYLAKIVKLGIVTKHPKADKLSICVIDGCSVISGLDAKEGDLYVYFPLECQINKDYLSYSNSFQDKELNRDKEIKSFFVKTGRVRAIKLRGIVSEGYIVPVKNFQEWLDSLKLKIKIDESLEGTSFDTIKDIEICRKYVVPAKNGGTPRNNNKKLKRESKLVENQFRLSLDLEHLKRNLHKINPDDIITISYKLHGCNTSIGRVLCKRPLNILEKFLKFVGVRIDDKQYDLVYASRNVIKNAYADKNHSSFYDEDVWGIVANRYKDTLKDGITLYGEIVGQMTTGAWIQKEYDYGVPENTCDLFVFRITYTSLSGDVFEFTTPQIQRYCAKMGLKMVPVFYHGKAKDYIPQFTVETHWHENFLNKLIEDYTEKRCYMCRNNVPEEGVVIAVENDTVQPFKLKSLKFLERETSLLDTGETNIEDDGDQTND